MKVFNRQLAFEVFLLTASKIVPLKPRWITAMTLALMWVSQNHISIPSSSMENRIHIHKHIHNLVQIYIYIYIFSLLICHMSFAVRLATQQRIMGIWRLILNTGGNPAGDNDPKQRRPVTSPAGRTTGGPYHQVKRARESERQRIRRIASELTFHSKSFGCGSIDAVVQKNIYIA